MDSADQYITKNEQHKRTALNQQSNMRRLILTFGDNKTSKNENHQQGEGTHGICNHLNSPSCSNESEEGQCHLMYAKECQELLDEPNKREIYQGLHFSKLSRRGGYFNVPAGSRSKSNRVVC